jgi:hypothetical protein
MLDFTPQLKRMPIPVVHRLLPPARIRGQIGCDPRMELLNPFLEDTPPVPAAR